MDSTTLHIEPLGVEDALAMVSSLDANLDLSEAARDQILHSAEGNPLFLEEALGMLQDERANHMNEEPPIPRTVQQILEARLDRLGPLERRTLERAAVIGKEFREKDVRTLTPSDEAHRITVALDMLLDRDLIAVERRTRQGRTFSFRHILIRDVAEEGAPKATRAEDHCALGELLEEQAGERLGEIEAIVGYHFETAAALSRSIGKPSDQVDPMARRAAEHLASAGRRASAMGQAASASLLGRALSLMAPDDPAAPELWRLRAQALIESGAPEEAEQTIRRGIEAAEGRGNEVEAWRLRLEEADLIAEFRPEDYDGPARELLAAQAIEGFEKAGDLAGLARGQRFLGDTLVRRGHQADATAMYALARRNARESNDPRERAEVSTGGAVIGSLPASQCLEMIDDLLADAGRPTSHLLAAKGTVLAMLNRHEEATATLDESLRRATELGAELWVNSSRMYAALARLLANDAAGTEAVIRPATESLQRMGAKNFLASAACLLAESMWRQGYPDEAMLATAIAENVATSDDTAAEMGWCGVRAKVLVDRGDDREAVQLAQRAARAGQSSDLLLFAGWAYEDLAYVFRCLGQTDDATAAQETARQLYSQKGSIASLRHLPAPVTS
jgi:hypothetical protein